VSGLKIARGFTLPLDLVTEATAIVATRGAGKSSASAVIVEEAFRERVQAVVFDRTGVYWGLRSNSTGDGPGLGIYVLGGPHGDVPLEVTAGAVIADLVVDSGHSFVLDLSDFSKANTIRFAADFLERVYDRKARARSTTLLIMDEAHFYAPQTPRGGFKGDSARLMGAMEDVVGLGRSRGLGVVLTTQRTQSLNKAVLDLIETLLVMRMLSSRARNAVSEWIDEKHEDDEQGVIPSLKSLPTGTAWVWSPVRGLLEKVAIRRIKTFDSYATPKPGETRVEPTARKELDLDALGDRMRATLEKAKAEDPKELRKQLAAAHRQVRELEQRPERVPEPPEPERIEVPVVSDDQLARLDRFADGLADTALRLAAEVSDLRAAAESVTDAVTLVRRARDTPPPAPQPSSAPPPPARRPVIVPRIAPPADVDGDFRPSGAQQRVLDTLAWFEMLGIHAPSRAALAPMAGSRPTSGGFKNNLGALRTAGLLDYPEGGRVQLTDPGRDIAQPPDTPATAEALQDAVMASVTGAQSRLLRALIQAYPDPLTRDELADQVQVPVTSGGFKNNLGALRTLELIDYPAAGQVVALPVLFPTGAHA
jgi:hypothetical protein